MKMRSFVYWALVSVVIALELLARWWKSPGVQAVLACVFLSAAFSAAWDHNARLAFVFTAAAAWAVLEFSRARVRQSRQEAARILRELAEFSFPAWSGDPATDKFLRERHQFAMAAALKFLGIRDEPPTDENPGWLCKKCTTVNARDATTCTGCGQVLDLRAPFWKRGPRSRGG